MDQSSSTQQIKYRFRKNFFEMEAWAQNNQICGIDEVGRGCLAGPVVTAAVMLPQGKTSPLLKDSKLMTHEERLKAFKWIDKNCVYSVGITHHRLIDRHNIWNATLIAMKKALVNLLAISPRNPSLILVDAMPLRLLDTNYKDIPVHYFPFGEQRSSSIAAASIVAKIKRDALMARLDTAFPGYYLGQHKGYSTPLHKKIIIDNSQHLIIHRMSYLNRLAKRLEEDHEEQQTLC